MRTEPPGNDASQSSSSSAHGDALASISMHREGTSATIKLIGEFDLYARGLLANEVRALLDEARVERINLDASELRFMDSSGLATLLAFRAAAAATEVGFRIIAASPQFTRLVDLAGLTSVLSTSPR